jgi:hypothetical protein
MKTPNFVASAVQAAVIAMLARSAPHLGVFGPWAEEIGAFLRAHTAIIPFLLNPSLGALAAAAPWGVGALSSSFAGALPKAPGLQTLASLISGPPAAWGAGPALGVATSEATLAGMSGLFHLDRTGALLALTAAGWTGLLTRIFARMLGLGKIGILLAFLPMWLAGSAAAFIGLVASTYWPAEPGTPAAAVDRLTRRHGLDPHTFLHATAVGFATSCAAAVTGASSFRGTLLPIAAYGAHKLYTNYLAPRAVA